LAGVLPMAKFNLTAIQKSLADKKLDGWLFYDYRSSDPVGRKILDIPDGKGQTRRWFYFIPVKNTPVKIVHGIERTVLDHLPGKKIVYLSWEEMNKILSSILKSGEVIAAQYSPKGALPYVSRIDAGTFELFKSFKIKIKSSADLLQEFEAKWTPAQLNTHKNAAKLIYEVIENAFRHIKRKIQGHHEITEYDLQRYLMTELKRKGLIFDHPPLVATGKNSGDPHYLSTKDKSTPIFPKSIIQLNLWAKEKEDNAVYAVVAWVGYVGKSVPENVAEKFAKICQARDLAVTKITEMIKKNTNIYGWQIDDLIRNDLKVSGYDSYFLHRSGHSIGREVNDVGTNIDNFETRDNRQIIANTCFSIEPGLYFSDYGMRSEINVYVDKNGAHVYTLPIQNEIVPILK
jgi:Xaa-Pro dipeptidase